MGDAWVAPTIAEFKAIRRRFYSARAGQATTDSSTAPDQPLVRKEQHHQEHQEQKVEESRVFDFSCESYTPQMWMEDLETLDACRNDRSPPFDPLRLHVAAASSRTDFVQCMLGRGYDKDGLDGMGRTPLHTAAQKGLMSMAQALLAAGANASLRCHEHWSALDWAVAKGHVEVARVIIEHGADANATGALGYKPLHLAVSLGVKPEMVSLLCHNGADIHALDRLGRTPIHISAVTGCASAAQALLRCGADVTESSLLGWAVDEGHVDVARMFIEHGADVNASSGTRGDTPLHHAASADNAEMVSLLCQKMADVDKANNEGLSPLHLAAIVGHPAVTTAILDAGPDVTLRENTIDLSPLDIAAALGHVNILRMLVEYGAHVNATNTRGLSALHFAGIENEAGAIDVLVSAGANVELEDANGDTPLHLAANKSSLVMILALLKHGASTNKQNALGFTPLHYAASKAGTLGAADVVQSLLRQGADENIKNSDGLTVADVVGSQVEEQDSLAEDVKRVQMLLANAPADRAWRRRGFLVLCRAHYSSGRVQLRQAASRARACVAKRTRGCAKSARAEFDWAGVVSVLMEDGTDLIFETIVGYL